MAEFNVIKLTHLSPLHLGNGNESYDFSSSWLQSDTLSAALAAMRCQRGKCSDVRDFLSSFAISSALPFFADTFFMPLPLSRKIPLQIKGKHEHEYRKDLKKAQYIELSLWKQLVSGDMVTLDLNQMQGKYICKQNSRVKIAEAQVVQRVFVPRDDEDARPFFFEWNFFDPEAGLYCIVDADSNTWGEIQDLFAQLGETGIGTDKNIGGGKFSVEASRIDLPTLPDANATMLLSLYLPTEEELPLLHLSHSCYNMLNRCGFMAGSSESTLRHLRKKSIYMFAPGSVFRTTTTLEGKIVDLRPDWNDPLMHPVFRSGKPLSIGIKQ